MMLYKNIKLLRSEDMRIQDLQKYPKLFHLACDYTKSEKTSGAGVTAIDNNNKLIHCFNFIKTSEGARFWGYVNEGDIETAKLMFSESFYFEVGNWYSNINWYSNNYDEYLKLKDIDYKDKSFVTSEVISFGKYKKGKIKGSIPANRLNYKKVDLSEIQKYLPRGHADIITKKPLFEKDAWYKFGKCWYGKIKRDWEISECIEKNGKYRDSKNLGASAVGKDAQDRKTFHYEKLEDLSEIQKYLPEGHVDKFKKMKSDIILKPGYVYYTEFGKPTARSKCDSANLFLYISGTIAKMKCYCYNYATNKVEKSTRNFSHERYQKNLRFATENEVSNLEKLVNEKGFSHFGMKTEKQKNTEFKVGDYVVITKSTKNWNNDGMDPFKGKCVKIEAIGGNKSITFKGCGQWDWNYLDGHFRLATKQEIPKEELFGNYKYPIGPIEFPEKYYKEGNIPRFYTQTEGIPEDLLVHGSIIISPNKNIVDARIVDYYENFYIVEYTDNRRKRVRLAFKEESLVLVEDLNLPKPKPVGDFYYMDYVYEGQEEAHSSNNQKDESGFKRLNLFKPKLKTEIQSKSVKQVKFRKIKRL